MVHIERIGDLFAIKDADGRSLAYCASDTAEQDAERICRALILQEVIDHRTEVFRSIAEKWQDGSKL